ncbi:ABC transporter substrate-binding protein [Nocardioides zeae]|uniref:4,5-dihydroxyphthalate decarboxylase n=1 Tax=Nocardioides zeae TaxID=1457234 RepID=A0AAJ1X3H0_9ACTN|nr:PhnD/SsuA/transferrin family substrate-binding protein [Nocardioides zeae]MDQ1105699.1 4,5-dihydroxyphthalate decarboxylase [Nocardioides zeae]
MTKLELSLALRTNPRVQALVDDPHAIEGVRLRTSLLPPADTFWRQLNFQDFDISEMSLASLTRLRLQGDDTWVALPVFPDRRFFHAAVVVRADSDVRTPADLRGKRIGVADYSMTGAVWARGVLQHDHDLHPSSMTWFQERTTRLSHGGATSFRPPEDVEVVQIGPDDSQRRMFAEGRLEASILFITYKTMLDRSTGSMDEANVRLLFPDDDAEKARAFGTWGFLPFNHCMVVRRSLVEAHPWLLLNIYKGFLDAKTTHLAALQEAVRLHREVGLVPASGSTDVDLFPYGLRANAHGLDTLSRFFHEQGITPSSFTVRELFDDRFASL